MTCSMCGDEADIAVQWANDDTGVITIKSYCESHYELLRVVTRSEKRVELAPIETVFERTKILAN